jgi:hypothetical protein
MNDPRKDPFDPPWIAGMSPAALSLEKTPTQARTLRNRQSSAAETSGR